MKSTSLGGRFGLAMSRALAFNSVLRVFSKGVPGFLMWPRCGPALALTGKFIAPLNEKYKPLNKKYKLRGHVGLANRI